MDRQLHREHVGLRKTKLRLRAAHPLLTHPAKESVAHEAAGEANSLHGPDADSRVDLVMKELAFWVS